MIHYIYLRTLNRTNFDNPEDTEKVEGILELCDETCEGVRKDTYVRMSDTII